MFGFKKNAYRFEIMNSDNIQSEEIKDADSLVNYVIGVNNHLIDMEESGWLFIEKIKETKKGPIVLYVAKLELPNQEETVSFDHLLSPFYTRKKLSYDKTLVSPLSEDYIEDKSNSKEDQTPELPEALAALADKGANELEKEDLFESVEEVVQEKQLNQSSEQQQQMNELINQMKKQQEEIKELKQMKREESLTTESISVPIQPDGANSFLVDEYSHINSNETVSEELTPVEEAIAKNEASIPELTSQPSHQVVQDVLAMVKNEFSTRLTNFVTNEMEKINEEIKQLDTRGTIENEISVRIEKEKEQAIKTESARLSLEKQSLLQEEKQRHETALSSIEASYVKNMDLKLQEFNSSYESRRQTEITEEYQRQTKQLSLILQGKKEELSLRQQDLNEGLKDDFTQVLASFNANHEQVIQQIEKQKEQNVPIDFLAHLKRA